MTKLLPIDYTIDCTKRRGNFPFYRCSIKDIECIYDKPPKDCPLEDAKV